MDPPAPADDFGEREAGHRPAGREGTYRPAEEGGAEGGAPQEGPAGAAGLLPADEGEQGERHEEESRRMVHEARASEQEDGREEEARPRDPRPRLAVDPPGEGDRHDDRTKREEDRHEPRRPAPQAERQEGGVAGGVLRVPPVLVDDQVLRGEELRKRGGWRLHRSGGEDARLEELHDLVDHDRPATEDDHRDRDQRDACRRENERKRGGSKPGRQRTSPSPQRAQKPPRSQHSGQPGAGGKEAGPEDPGDATEEPPRV